MGKQYFFTDLVDIKKKYPFITFEFIVEVFYYLEVKMSTSQNDNGKRYPARDSRRGKPAVGPRKRDVERVNAFKERMEDANIASGGANWADISEREDTYHAALGRARPQGRKSNRPSTQVSKGKPDFGRSQTESEASDEIMYAGNCTSSHPVHGLQEHNLEFSAFPI